MSILDIFKRKDKQEQKTIQDGYVRVISGQQPFFSSWNSCLYESELVRSAIDARARHISKLRIEIQTSKQSKLLTYMRHQPNKLMTWSQFMYRVSTILDMHNTCFIVPIFDDKNYISGYYPILPATAKVVEGPVVEIGRNGDWSIDKNRTASWLTYRMRSGRMESVPLSLCAVLTRFQYMSDFFGETNDALSSTMQLVHLQNQAIENAVKSSAAYRFIAQVSNFTKPDDLANERKRFTEENLSADSDAGGLLLFPNTYMNIEQIKSENFVINEEQMKLAEKNILNYFGVSEDILQNKCFGDAWSAFYEGAVEPFAIQFSECMTRALFTDIERSNGSILYTSSNRLQYLSNNDKLNVSAQMADRGIMTRNEIRDIWNLEPLPHGDAAVIRGEYYIENDKGQFVKDGGQTDEE